jgi:hypothetical protein
VRLAGERSLAANPVDRAISRGRRQPRTGMGRPAVTRPAFGRDRECLLGGFLGEVEVAEKADQVRNDSAPLVAEDVLGQR